MIWVLLGSLFLVWFLWCCWLATNTYAERASRKNQKKVDKWQEDYAKRKNLPLVICGPEGELRVRKDIARKRQ